MDALDKIIVGAALPDMAVCLSPAACSSVGSFMGGHPASNAGFEHTATLSLKYHKWALGEDIKDLVSRSM